MEEKIEKALIEIMKAQAISNSLEELYEEEWEKIGPKGKYAVTMQVMLHEIIDKIERYLEEAIEE